MTCAERIEAIFRGEMVDRVPFALKGWRVPPCRAERALRNGGMGIVDNRPVYSTRSPNTETETLSFSANGIAYERVTVKTPRGVLSSVHRRMGGEKTEGTSWLIEPIFKGPEDYAAIEFMIRDRRYAPAYEGFLKAQAQMEGEAFFKTGAPGAPLHTVMYSVMGLETFSIEWAERRDRVMALCEAMAENQREVYPLVARSPALVVQCGGNYSSEVLGKQRFVEHVLPHWEEVGAVLHEGGKLLGCHLDANNRLWAGEVGASALDWIEAFTPAPDTDMTVADARAMWPGKTLFINFPSSVHLDPPERIAEATKQMLREAAPGERFIVGITENVPENRWRESFSTILETVNRYGTLPIRPGRF
ncbi:hypothetical protein HYY27_04725 [bacterium]|nr:hypothetical protein [bacterium]